MNSIEQRLQRAALLASGIDAFGTGSFVSAAAIIFSSYNHVSAGIIGLGLTFSAVSGMIASMPAAYLADRIGGLRVFTYSYLLRAVGMLGWLIISGDAAFLVYMTLFGIIDRSAASLTRGLIIAPLSREQATILLGRMALPTNVGYALGAALSTMMLLIQYGNVIIVAANSLSFVVVVVLYRRALKGCNVTAAKVKRSPLTSWTVFRTALTSRSRSRLIIENFLFSFHRTLLNVYLPLLIIHYAPTDTWQAPAIFVANTVVIALAQGPVNHWATKAHNYALAWRCSGLLQAIAFIAVACIPFLSHDFPFIALVMLLAMLQIIAELLSTAGITMYMALLSRKDYLTTDLSAINLGGQFQNIVGPSLFASTITAANCVLPAAMGIAITLAAVLPRKSE